MESSTVKKTSLLSALGVSMLLMTATIDSNAVAAPTQTANGTQLALWIGVGGGGYHGGWGYRPYGYGGYRPYGYGGYRPGYWNGGYRNVCRKNCWRNRYGNLRCNTRCY